MGEEVTVLHKAVIAGPGSFWGLFMDETYILLFFSKPSPTKRGTEDFIIEIRNATSFEIKTVIKFDYENMPHDFHYSNRLVVTGHRGKPIR